MATRLVRTLAAVGTSVALTGAMLIGAAGTAEAATPTPVAAVSAQSSASPVAERWHLCPRGQHWHYRWFDNRGWWDSHHHWQRGRWHNGGCW